MTAELIDEASALEEMMRDNAIQAHRLNHSAVSATHCEECGDNLPEARRRLAGGSPESVSGMHDVRGVPEQYGVA